MVSLSDIAKRVKLDVSVVSRALSHKPAQNAKVKTETREFILQTAAEMGYRPNRQASFMGKKGDATIFCFMPQISDQLTADLMYGISAAARRENFPVTFFQGNMDGDFRNFLAGLDDSNHSGVISFPTRALSDDLKELLILYHRRRKTLLLLNPQSNSFGGQPEDGFSNIPHLIMDDAYGGSLAAKHLIGKGCQHFFFTGFPGQHFRHRFAGYREELARHSVEAVSFDSDDELKKIVALPGRIGIYADRDTHAINLIIRLAHLGITPGEKVLLVGNDDKQQSRLSGLTTIHQPIRQEGELAVKKLINLIFGGTEENEFIKPYLVVRQSTGNYETEYIVE
ncbi:MAG: LacI family transcriptional regulator [Lentisphaerae bacterium]|nr:LacI family transcriptional regulator [Lentisphaerota bacterium]